MLYDMRYMLVLQTNLLLFTYFKKYENYKILQLILMFVKFPQKHGLQSPGAP